MGCCPTADRGERRRGGEHDNTRLHCEYTPSVFEQCALVLLVRAQPLQAYGSAAAHGLEALNDTYMRANGVNDARRDGGGVHSLTSISPMTPDSRDKIASSLVLLRFCVLSLCLSVSKWAVDASLAIPIASAVPRRTRCLRLSEIATDPRLHRERNKSWALGMAATPARSCGRSNSKRFK
jgi:hypothetical protein